MFFFGKNSLSTAVNRYEETRFLEAPDLRFALAAPSFALLGLDRDHPMGGTKYEITNQTDMDHMNILYIYVLYIYVYIYI